MWKKIITRQKQISHGVHLNVKLLILSEISNTNYYATLYFIVKFKLFKQGICNLLSVLSPDAFLLTILIARLGKKLRFATNLMCVMELMVVVEIDMKYGA